MISPIPPGRRFGGRRGTASHRPGTAVVEMALIAPLAMLLVIGFVVMGLGVFRYHQLAALARDGARWASVHGSTYEIASHRGPITADDVYAKVIRPRAVGLDMSRLTYDVTWGPNRATVAVTVNYAWLPEAYFGAVQLSSRTEMPVSY